VTFYTGVLTTTPPPADHNPTTPRGVVLLASLRWSRPLPAVELASLLHAARRSARTLVALQNSSKPPFCPGWSLACPTSAPVLTPNTNAQLWREPQPPLRPWTPSSAPSDCSLCTYSSPLSRLYGLLGYSTRIPRGTPARAPARREQLSPSHHGVLEIRLSRRHLGRRGGTDG
jgi:hypothetical protein